MKVKVCGLTQPANIRACIEAGADYVGFIFYEASPRYAANGELKSWLQEIPAELAPVKKVGVFVNAGVDIVLNTVHDYQLDYVQLHGSESAGYCEELQLLWSVNTLRKAKIAKAFSIDDDFDFDQTRAYTASCTTFVFDTGGHRQQGGTGQQWDWSRLSSYQGLTPFLLSGGIGPNDAPAIRQLDHPQLLGVDLNSRFETTPGAKDALAIHDFIRTLHQ